MGTTENKLNAGITDNDEDNAEASRTNIRTSNKHKLLPRLIIIPHSCTRDDTVLSFLPQIAGCCVTFTCSLQLIAVYVHDL